MVVTACEAAPRPDESGGDPAKSTVLVERRTEEIPANQDFGTLDLEDRRRVGIRFGAPEVELGFLFALTTRPGPAVLRFPIDGDPDCVVEATLHIRLTDAAPEVALAAYPVRPDSLPAVEGAEIPSWGLLLDRRPRGVFEIAGRAGAADVTDLVRTWLAGGPFPSMQRRVSTNEPLTVAVQPESATSSRTVRMLTSESGPDLVPRLRVTTSC